MKVFVLKKYCDIFVLMAFFVFIGLSFSYVYANDIPPQVPNGVVATQIPGTPNVLVQWNDNSHDESKFYISRQIIVQNVPHDFFNIAVVDENITSYTDTNTAYGLGVCYTVSATNGATISNESLKGCVTPTKPTSVSSSITPAKNAPVITVNPATVTINLGGTYYQADAMRGVNVVPPTLFGQVDVSNPVNTKVADTYTVTYSVTDDNGLTGTASRTVIVSGTSGGSGTSLPNVPPLVQNQPIYAPPVVPTIPIPIIQPTSVVSPALPVTTSTIRNTPIITNTAKVSPVVALDSKLDQVYVNRQPKCVLHNSKKPKGLVVIIHGYNSDVNGWVSDMGIAIKNNIPYPEDWDICLWGWSKDASWWNSSSIDESGVLSPVTTAIGTRVAGATGAVVGKFVGDSLHTPPDNLSSAERHGRSLGEYISLGHYDKVHFISHSEGAIVMHTAMSELIARTHSPRPKIHLTFLDAYVPSDTQNPLNSSISMIDILGMNADYAEQYLSIGNLFNTNEILKQAYNFVVNDWPSEKPKKNSDHEYPHIWYENSIKYPNEYKNYGFSLSMEKSGKDSLPTSAQFHKGSRCVLDGNNRTCINEDDYSLTLPLKKEIQPVSKNVTNFYTFAYTFTQTLSFGSRGTEVSRLQATLINLNLMQGSATGYFGPITQTAVKKYQEKYGIPQTGMVGPLTRAQLSK